MSRHNPDLGTMSRHNPDLGTMSRHNPDLCFRCGAECDESAVGGADSGKWRHFV